MTKHPLEPVIDRYSRDLSRLKPGTEEYRGVQNIISVLKLQMVGNNAE